MSAREFNVVIMGATGFTGRLVCRYLAEHYGTSVKWAMAGRSEDKLKEIHDELVREFPGQNLQKISYIVADSHNSEQLESLAKRTSVVMSTVGPFMKYGTQLLEACVKCATHYCDITGESPWVTQMMSRLQNDAVKNKVRLVPMSGFDSLPSDLGTKMVVDAMRARHGVGCTRVDTYITNAKGGISGGTLASMYNIFEQPSSQMKELGNPYELVPKDARPRHRQPGANIPWYASEVNRLTAPFIMASVNSKVVHRSSHLAGGYGPNFEYTEQLGMPLTVKGVFGVVGITMLTASLGTIMYFSWTRSLMKSYGPKPGQGPTEAQMKNGKLRMSVVAHGEAKPDGSVPVVSGMVGCNQDPGYSGTARMLCETALCLALEADKLPNKYGFLTPATAGGEVLVQRLKNNAGFIFEVNTPTDSASVSARL